MGGAGTPIQTSHAGKTTFQSGCIRPMGCKKRTSFAVHSFQKRSWWIWDRSENYKPVSEGSLGTRSHIEPPIELLLHAPIDRRVLDKLASPPKTWSSWTKVEAQDANSDEVKDYLVIQKTLRNFQKTSPVAFPSLIQMEQFIWHWI